MATPVDIIKQFVKALIETKSTGTDAVNAAFKDVGAVSYDVFTSKFTADQNGLSTQDFLEQKCGIRVYNTDTGAITGSDAGYSKTAKTAESIVPETAAAVELTSKQYNSFTKNGLTVNVTYLEKSDADAGENFDYSSDTYIEKQRLVTRALYNWWIPESLDLINQSLGINFTDGRASINEINVVFDDDFGSDECATAVEFNYDMGLASSATLYINANILYNMTANDKDGTLEDDKAIYSDFYGGINSDWDYHYVNHRTLPFTNYLDRIILQSLAEVAIKSNVSYAYYLPARITAALCEIVGGYDSGYNILEDFKDEHAGNSSYNYNDQSYGYGLMRYLAKNYSDDTPADTTPADTTPADTTPADTTPADTTPTALVTVNKTAKTSITGTTYEDEIINYAKNATLRGGDGNDLLTTMRKTSGVKLYGDTGNDTLEAYNATKVTLSGGADDDEIYAGGSQITILGGAGNDTIEIDASAAQIEYKSGEGNDFITGFNESSTLKIGNGTGDTYFSKTDGDDVIITVGNGVITLSGAAGLENLNIAGTLVDKVIPLDNDVTSPYTIAAGIETADASTRTKAIKITGNALDNSIVGGSGKDSLYGSDGSDTLNGGASNDKLAGQNGDDSLFGGAGNDSLSGGNGEDTLWGGTGNDTLTGGKGNDLFIYSGGKDIITDYAAGDAISLGAAVSKSSLKGSNVILTVGSGTLTIKNGKYKELIFIDEAGDDYAMIYGGVNLDNSAKTPYTLASDVELVNATERTTAIKITGNVLNNTIIGGGGKDTIYGKDGTDSLIGGAGNDKLYGDDGEDTLWGGAGNDTLTGGAEDDIFVYSGGKDVIADYVSGEDKILLGAEYNSVSFNGDNVILTINKSNTLTIKNAKYSDVTFIDANGEEYTETFGGLKLDNSSAAKVTLDSDVLFANASSRTTNIQITGNELNNTILGGGGKDTIYGQDGADRLLGGKGNDKLYGQEGDDYLTGGAGNDSLWGGEGSDTFLYNAGDGKDVICDFDEDDLLQISGDWSASYNLGTNTVIFQVNSTAAAITLKDFATDTFNVNGSSYEIKGTRFVEKE